MREFRTEIDVSMKKILRIVDFTDSTAGGGMQAFRLGSVRFVGGTD
jgi:hypothetical protein